MSTEGRTATKPYRVKAGGVWYWVDPTAPPGAIEPGDTVIVYPVADDAVLAILQSPFVPGDGTAADRPVAFSSLEGERFDVPARDIAALHLAAVDDEQGVSTP